jgi:hypothetical protein
MGAIASDFLLHPDSPLKAKPLTNLIQAPEPGIFHATWLMLPENPVIRVAESSRRSAMRQKFLIVQDPKKRILTIKEYAVIEKNLTNTDTSLLRPEDYSLLHEEVYDGPIIESSISDGKRALVAALRTPMFFPTEYNAVKIADSVIKLLHSKQDRSLEVFIDDLEGKGKKKKAEEEANAHLDAHEVLAEAIPV